MSNKNHILPLHTDKEQKIALLGDPGNDVLADNFPVIPLWPLLPFALIRQKRKTRDVARVYQMLLNGGEIDGQRYLSKETCQLFTTETSKISRRGLGFDKPDADDPKKGNCASAAPAEVYGHTGFTGTCAWVDPVNELVYVFLSNRIYPDVTNRKLNQLHIRERIQGAIYDAMKKK